MAHRLSLLCPGSASTLSLTSSAPFKPYETYREEEEEEEEEIG
jgi:hypothetical protein